jgi:hypothetical protein
MNLNLKVLIISSFLSVCFAAKREILIGKIIKIRKEKIYARNFPRTRRKTKKLSFDIFGKER